MAKSGSEYEQEACAFFRSLGLTAVVQAEIEGARGRHHIDVWVTGTIGAFDVQWVVECKDWRTNVPKEKVLALQAIVQDVGADRGWLLSETGFQAGAVGCARHTNITLTSLAELRDHTKDYICESTLQRLFFEIEGLVRQLHTAVSARRREADPAKGYWCPPYTSLRMMGRLSMMQTAVRSAMHGDYPICVDVVEEQGQERGLVAQSHDELVKLASSLLADRRKELINALDELDREEM